jgi:hypothetical protein
MSAQLAACFFAASLLNLTRTTWDFSYRILWDIGYNPNYTTIPKYVLVVFPILYNWVTVVLFGLLVVIGFKKRDGLWSQQQQLYGGGQGQGIPTSQPIGAGSDMPGQQPAHPETIGGAFPTWRAELAGPNYINSTQQYYGPQYQQQPPIVQNQAPMVYEVSGTQNERT